MNTTAIEQCSPRTEQNKENVLLFAAGCPGFCLLSIIRWVNAMNGDLKPNPHAAQARKDQAWYPNESVYSDNLTLFTSQQLAMLQI